jgi:hypothetical protein
MEEKKEDLKIFDIGVTVRKNIAQTPHARGLHCDEESTSISVSDEETHKKFVETLFAVFE